MTERFQIVANPIAINTEQAAELCNTSVGHFRRSVAPNLGVKPYRQGKKVLWSYQSLVDGFKSLSDAAGGNQRLNHRAQK